MIKFGIIGMSEGNAHPYSWSSIINGLFDPNEITNVGYPSVAAYLTANNDTLGIPDAKVTYIWTQEKTISQSIAKSSGIENVVDEYKNMIGNIDALLLLRDDAENHAEMAKPFIDANIPVFIDKPLAITEKDLHYFEDEFAKGKFIMSCSSMRYANELKILKQDIDSFGNILCVNALGKKDWEKYGVHMLEAVFSFLDDPVPVSVMNVGRENKHTVIVEFENGVRATIFLYQDVALTFQVSIFGERKWALADIKNSYSMFRDNIIEITRSVVERSARVDFNKTKNIIQTLLAARRSLNEGGNKILLSK